MTWIHLTTELKNTVEGGPRRVENSRILVFCIDHIREANRRLSNPHIERQLDKVAKPILNFVREILILNEQERNEDERTVCDVIVRDLQESIDDGVLDRVNPLLIGEKTLSINPI